MARQPLLTSNTQHTIASGAPTLLTAGGMGHGNATYTHCGSLRATQSAHNGHTHNSHWTMTAISAPVSQNARRMANHAQKQPPSQTANLPRGEASGQHTCLMIRNGCCNFMHPPYTHLYRSSAAMAANYCSAHSVKAKAVIVYHTVSTHQPTHWQCKSCMQGECCCMQHNA